MSRTLLVVKNVGSISHFFLLFFFPLCLGYLATPASSLKCAWWWLLIMGLQSPALTTRLSVLVRAKTLSQASHPACSPSSVLLTYWSVIDHVIFCCCFFAFLVVIPPQIYLVFYELLSWQHDFWQTGHNVTELKRNLFLKIRGTVLEVLWMRLQSSSARHLTAAWSPWSLSTRWRRMASWLWVSATGSNR